MLARSIARRFDLEFVAVAVPRDDDWDVYEAGAQTIELDRRQLSNAFAAAQATLEFDAHARTYAGHRTMTVDGHDIRLVPLRVGTKPIGILAAAGRPVEAGTLDTLAGVVAIAIERAQFLEERKAGELTRQSEQLKTALLASLGHDLRTPLTAIRVAASNIKASELTRRGSARAERPHPVGSRAADPAVPEHPRDGAHRRRRRRHRVAVDASFGDRRRGPRSGRARAAGTQAGRHDRTRCPGAAGSAADGDGAGPPARERRAVHAGRTRRSTSPRVWRTRAWCSRFAITAPESPPADLPHLFERFYRGAAAKTRASGTGMGLWIVARAAGRRSTAGSGRRITRTAARSSRSSCPSAVKATEAASSPS